MATPCSGPPRPDPDERVRADGSRLTLNFMGPGDLFGEVAVLDGESRTADATAGEPTELFVLRRRFSAISNASRASRSDHPAIVPADPLAERADGENPCCSRCRFRARAPARRAGIDYGSEVHISQDRLGVFVGARGRKCNAATAWRKDGILDLQRGRILLHNMTKLTRVARNE